MNTATHEAKSSGGPSYASSTFHLAAGLTSGITSATLLQPFDLLKTRVQQSPSSNLSSTLHTILHSRSPVIPQLWRGTLPSALRTGIGSALYFTTLNAFREQIALFYRGTNPQLNLSSSSTLPTLPALPNLLAGALARTVAGFVMMPVTVIKVRYESSFYSYTSLWSASRHVMKTEGMRGFFSGFGATTARDAPYAGLYVLFYEQGKQTLAKISTKFAAPDASAVEDGDNDGTSSSHLLTSTRSAQINFVSSTIAAVLATTITNPFDAVKTRLQLEPNKYRNSVQATRLMLGSEGMRSLFDGLMLRMARKALSSALAWTLYEELIRRAERRWGK